MTPIDLPRWMENRLTWVQGLSQTDLQRVMLVAALHHATLTDVEDKVRSSSAILWLATRGQEGNDWGLPPQHARTLGLWP